MKLSGILLFVLVAPNAFAQAAYQDMDTEKTIEIYASITSGWLLGKSCNILSTTEESDLKRNRDLVSDALKLRLRPEFFPMVEKTAQSVVSEEPYSSCSDSAKEAVRAAVEFAREWAGEIRDQKSSTAATISMAQPIPVEKAPVLPAKIAAEIDKTKKQAEALETRKQYKEALQKYWAAYDLLPKPQQNWRQTTLLLAAIGEVNFMLSDYAACRDNLSLAMHSPGAIGTPTIHIRLGACQYELGNMPRAADELARAYIPEGKAIFKEKDQKYLVFVKSKLLPPPGGWPNGW
jgi:tetratricopeptide (TPR) repeat protein